MHVHVNICRVIYIHIVCFTIIGARSVERDVYSHQHGRHHVCTASGMSFLVDAFTGKRWVMCNVATLPHPYRAVLQHQNTLYTITHVYRITLLSGTDRDRQGYRDLPGLPDGGGGVL